MIELYNNCHFFNRKKVKQILFICLIFCVQSFKSTAQCPPNIDFELGNFTGWQTWTGNVAVDNSGPAPVNKINLNLTPGPVLNRHTMNAAVPGSGIDSYGGFPVDCPNGSGYSVKIGNNSSGSQAEGVSYTYTIPAGQNQFNIIYHYAVVFQGPQHFDYEQPRLVIDVYNLTDNQKITCSSFEFFKTNNQTLPGFFLSANPQGPTEVWCKNWAATSIKLDGFAGKTIQVFFKTADCTRSGHFGYAYVDVNTECSSAFTGASYCPDDAFIDVTAPFGYATYEWWDVANPAVILGTTQTINFTPPPPGGTVLNVAVTPYAGYGCVDTLTAYLWDTLNVFANAGPDRLSCQNAPVQLGIAPTAGFVYSWSPVAGLSNPNISNPVATPSNTTTYVLTVRNIGGGCLTTDTVLVKAAVLDNTLTLTGINAYCLGDPQAAVLSVAPADSIQWYLNGTPIVGANSPTYNVVQTGTYHATVFSFQGCNLTTVDEFITVHAQPVAGFTANTTDQCFTGHQFDFTNTSTIAAGTMAYNWDLGDGTTASTQDVSHSYAQAGIYTVKLITTSNNGCSDSVAFDVRVRVSTIPGFNIDKTDQCFINNNFSFTSTSTVPYGAIGYSWYMGDGSVFSSVDVIHSYANPGTFNVKLVTVSDEGCADSVNFDVFVDPMPVAGFTSNNTKQCLDNNQFVFTNNSTVAWGTLNYFWNFGDGNTATTRDVTHQYAQPGTYTVSLQVTSNKGCVDRSSFAVTVYEVPFAGFIVTQPACVNNPLQLINTTANNTTSTLNYVWDFDNGYSSVIRNPIYSYPSTGVYTISLSVSTSQCPTSFTTTKKLVNIETPMRGIRYADKEAIFNFPEKLQARPIGNSVLWTPATNLDNRISYTPYFRGINSQLYTIELKTPSGCLTVDTLLVKAVKKIKIYVPTAFTPSSSTGLNDYLRPLLYGFTKVNYFRIYNRWGKMLFQMQSDRPGWDGKVNGQILDPATYVWMIEAIDVDGNVHREQGTTILLR